MHAYMHVLLFFAPLSLGIQYLHVFIYIASGPGRGESEKEACDIATVCNSNTKCLRPSNGFDFSYQYNYERSILCRNVGLKRANFPCSHWHCIQEWGQSLSIRCELSQSSDLVYTRIRISRTIVVIADSAIRSQTVCPRPSILFPHDLVPRLGCVVLLKVTTEHTMHT